MRLWRWLKGERGFTAVEMLAVLMLLGLVVAVAYSFQLLSYDFLRTGEPQAQAQADLRRLLDGVARDARQARSVVLAGQGELQLLDLDGQTVRYWLDGEVAWRQRGADPAQEVARGVTAFSSSYDPQNRLLSLAAEAREEGSRRFGLASQVRVRNQP
ncbi:MAG: prepilin-type N-terminal cleavage/methylation domain-containing protein [Acetobacteraceae bacterium]|nr:prepilin-type N-terminal cleavage/methylation domain-containing protein [Acetobacteraceae bacterium]